jgi:hypothetical protein
LGRCGHRPTFGRRELHAHRHSDAGQDIVNAQGGDDVIYARDGESDTIVCGGGVDKVTADRSDVVKNREYVKRPVRAA